METAQIVALAAALLGLAGAVGAALISRRHDRQQQTRALQLPAAQEFVRSAYAGLAALRYVTPPSRGPTPHRNEELLLDREARVNAFVSAGEKLDSIRSARATVRVVYHPESLAAQLSVWVIGHLRRSLELAEDFYRGYDAAAENGRGEPWRDADGATKRAAYKQDRETVYRLLDEFAAEVAVRMVKPSWNPRKFKHGKAATEAEASSAAPAVRSHAT